MNNSEMVQHRVVNANKPAKVIVQTSIGLEWANVLAAGALREGFADSVTIQGYDGSGWRDIATISASEVPSVAAEMGSRGGKKGGKATSEAKRAAARENGKKGGRRKQHAPQEQMEESR